MADAIKKYQTRFISKTNDMIEVIIPLATATTFLFLLSAVVAFKNISDANKIRKEKFSKFKAPFRVGRKQKRAIINSQGVEVVIFPAGSEDLAELTCKLLNRNLKDL